MHTTHSKPHAYSKSVVLEVLLIEDQHQKLLRGLDIPGPHPDLLNQNFWEVKPRNLHFNRRPRRFLCMLKFEDPFFDSLKLLQTYGLTAVEDP